MEIRDKIFNLLENKTILNITKRENKIICIEFTTNEKLYIDCKQLWFEGKNDLLSEKKYNINIIFSREKFMTLKNIKLINYKDSKDFKFSYIYFRDKLYIYKRYIGYWQIEMDFEQNVIDIIREMSLFLIEYDEYGDDFMKIFEKAIQLMKFMQKIK